MLPISNDQVKAIVEEYGFMNDYVYDIEVYPNVFTCAVYSCATGKSRVYEISPRMNELGPFRAFMNRLRNRSSRMIGFNNMGYDYPVIHHLLTNFEGESQSTTINKAVYNKSDEIISMPFNHPNKFQHVIWPNKQLVQQVDLLKVHHFDNVSKTTSLKVLEYNMMMTDIRDLPYTPGTYLTDDEIENLVAYNKHDVMAQFLFHLFTAKAHQFRRSLSLKYSKDFTNANDTKIGKDYFIMQLERFMGAGACYTKDDKGKRKPRQTKRKEIALADVIFDYVEFETPEFSMILDWMENQVIKETKGVFTELPEDELGEICNHCDMKKTKGLVKNLNVILDGVKFVFGTGGIHASIHKECIESDDEYMILDLDVTSYYPSLAIANQVYPEHLSSKFCEIYADMKAQRVGFAKGTPENAMLKLALNGVYGDSNSKFSPLYDPKYTMSITVNGQLTLCMLYERLRHIDGLRLIQVNTDGLTVHCKRNDYDRVMGIASSWERRTGLTLESVEYSLMFIRDVNNYLAVKTDGSIKGKGAYESRQSIFDKEGNINMGKDDWNKDHSLQVIPKAAVANIVHGIPVDHFIKNHDIDYDFMIRGKVPKTSKLMVDYGMGIEFEEQKTIRYYVTKDGPELIKVMPPTKAKPEKWRRIAMSKGCSVEIVNDKVTVDRDKVDFDWYIEQANKLVKL